MSKWRREIRSGPFVEVCLYSLPDFRDTDRSRAEKRKHTTAAQKALNLKSATKRLARILACNFGRRDLFITLTYDDEHLPGSIDRAKENVRRFISQLRQLRKDAGQILKYVYTTEGLHGEHRYHHHIVLNAVSREDLELIRFLWQQGSADVKRIHKCHFAKWEIPFPDCWKYPNYAGVAGYLTKEKAEDRPNGAQAWTPSRNLERPAIQSIRVPDDMTIETPPGAIEIDRREAKNIYSSFRYLEYIEEERKPPQPPGSPAERLKRAG